MRPLCPFSTLGPYEKLHFHFLRRPLSGISSLALFRTGAAPLRACLSPRSPVWLTSQTHATEAEIVAAEASHAVEANSALRAVGFAAPAAAPQHTVRAHSRTTRIAVKGPAVIVSVPQVPDPLKYISGHVI